MTRIFMLGFIFSRMLNPLSYSVFIVFFLTIYLSAMEILPMSNWSVASDVVTSLYTPLLFIRLILFGIAFSLFILLILQVIFIGKFIVKLSTLSFIIALCISHILVYYAVHSLPLILSLQHKQHALYHLFESTPIELVTTIVLGIMLSLYIGILSREKFKKNIGFIDDNIAK